MAFAHPGSLFLTDTADVRRLLTSDCLHLANELVCTRFFVIRRDSNGYKLHEGELRINLATSGQEDLPALAQLDTLSCLMNASVNLDHSSEQVFSWGVGFTR
jgi:hypothetical protein